MTKPLKTRYKRPDIAWPTLCVFGLAILLTIFSCALGTGWIFPVIAFSYPTNASYLYWIISTLLGILCFIVSTICSYTQFTVAHDAVHRSVSKKYKSLNDWVGCIAQIWLGPTSSWNALKYNHLEHHKHTNNSESDPDYWCSEKGPGGKHLMLLRWLFVDISYFHFYYLKSMYKRSINAQIQAYSYEIFKILLLVLAYSWGYLPFLLQYWILPSRAALFVLAFAFDFLPHYPHEVTRKENRYKTTAYFYIPWILRPFLSLLTFNQNYHLTHHLRPEIPFYRYGNVWEDTKDRCLEEGIIVRDILPKLIGEKIASVLGDEEYEKLQKCKSD